MAKMIRTVFQPLKDLPISNPIWAVLITEGAITVTIQLFGQIMGIMGLLLVFIHRTIPTMV